MRVTFEWLGQRGVPETFQWLGAPMVPLVSGRAYRLYYSFLDQSCSTITDADVEQSLNFAWTSIQVRSQGEETYAKPGGGQGVVCKLIVEATLALASQDIDAGADPFTGPLAGRGASLTRVDDVATGQTIYNAATGQVPPQVPRCRADEQLVSNRCEPRCTASGTAWDPASGTCRSIAGFFPSCPTGEALGFDANGVLRCIRAEVVPTLPPAPGCPAGEVPVYNSPAVGQWRCMVAPGAAPPVACPPERTKTDGTCCPENTTFSTASQQCEPLAVPPPTLPAPRRRSSAGPILVGLAALGIAVAIIAGVTR